ncbi:peptidoglycan DD-metalloendopeptidase family protein [Dolichospermum flos-aquae]|uniref:Peptidoglycan DD-metalloendopeptidase family protein n=1 Tax=Dolichospermum flos-aquae LEGE 04289 TaxID=1828708 RepID=A0ACC5Q2U8_DOLFA|nr:peptidoglycan DD-metalloendopeptidase family protein [Dolichospermum flos-aquae]MBE9218972.1 peptidoglycan DD-metalloendopeptidase family protein [Dolichospermum flos-aquae LEGE 04289]
MKRALKKRGQAVLKNSPIRDDAPGGQTTDDKNPQITLRSRTHQAAMIGLAISMGAASLLVTRQSDQAQAAAPVDSQKAASTNSVVSETEMKFTATKLESQSISQVGGVVNPVILEPTVVSRVPGPEAKWQIATNNTPVLSEASRREETTSNVISPINAAEKNSVHSQSQLAQGVSNRPIQSTLAADNQETETAQQLSNEVAAAELAGGSVDAKLKAQQEVALNRLQEKSTRLRNSLAQLRDQRTQNRSNTGINEEQPTTGSNNSVAKQSKNLTGSSQAELVTELKQNQEPSATVQQIAMPGSTSTKVAAQLPPSTYQVKPGDTLAEIANNYGISVSELVKANNLSDPYQLQISQNLIIPAAKMVEKVNRVDNPVNTPSFNTNSFVANNTSVIVPSPIATEQPKALDSRATNNSVTIPVPVVTGERQKNNNPSITNRINVPAPITPAPITNYNQGQIPIAIPQALPTPGESFGLGGDAPLPRNLSPKPVEKVSKGKGNERIRSLQAEIERLRYKYRAQESGVAATGSKNNSQSVPVPIESTNNRVVSQVGLQIPVPKAILPSYNNQPVQPLVTDSGSTNEPINPEFMPSKTGVGWNSAPNSSGIKLTVPSPGISASDSLGKLRGTNVSPALPPLAAVDIYLPKTTEENPNFPSNSTPTSYIWPAKGVLTSGYGWRWGRMHRGIDIANSVGTPIYASSAGVVEKAGWNSGGYGNLVDIRHDDGSLTRYGHNSRILVQAGQRVQQGQTIAAMGSTGFSTGPHSHFEVHPSGKGAVNPIAFLPNRL